MSSANHESLAEALRRREQRCTESIVRLRELATDDTEDEVADLTRDLYRAVELIGCLRRLVDGRTADEIHDAFGAPGDWGYETPVGAALARLYRGAVPR